MKTNFKVLKQILFVFLIITVVACSSEDPETPMVPTDSDGDGIVDSNDDCPNQAGTASNNGCPEESTLTIAQVVAQGEDFEEVPQVPQETTVNEEPPFDDDANRIDDGETTTERFTCTRRTVSIEDGSDDFFLFDPNESVIYPGNIIQGKTIDDATPESIPLLRGGGVISYNIIDGNLNASQQVDTISLSAVRTAQNAIIAGASGAVPASFNLSVESVQSRRELALKLGVKFETFNTKLSGDFELNTSNETNYVMVKLTQRFYTMDVDEPTSANAFFDESVTPEELAEFIQPDNPAAYIASVTYGRVFYMLFESTSSTSEMLSKLNLGYSTLGGSASGSVEYNAFSSLQELKLQVIAYGGNAEETLEAVGNFTNSQSIGDFIAGLGQSGDIETALPLSYVLKSVKGRSDIVGTNLSTEFDVVDCELKGTLPPQVFLNLDRLFDDGIGAATQVSLSNFIVFNTSGTKYAWYNATSGEVSEIFDIKDENGPLGTVVMDAVGAGVHFGDDSIYLFDDTGLLAQILLYDSSQYTTNSVPNEPIGTYFIDNTDGDTIFLVDEIFGDASNFAFLGEGFGAACRFFESTDDSPPRPIMHFFRKPGDRYADYRPIGVNGQWLNPIDTNGWGGPDNQPYFDRIGAACRIQSAGAANARQLFFNDTGDEFIIWNPANTSTDPDTKGEDFDGPFVIN